MLENRKLDTFSLAALLVSAHYGLGFLLGTKDIIVFQNQA